GSSDAGDRPRNGLWRGVRGGDRRGGRGLDQGSDGMTAAFVSPLSLAAAPADGALAVAGATFVADVGGVIYWPEQGLLAVADLHLEKGSSFAERGVLLPPYDTAVTLAALGALIARYAPHAVVALGDSFHDGGGPARLADTDRATLRH